MSTESRRYKFWYDCERCGSHDELGAAGGFLSCTCVPQEVSAEDIVVTKLKDGVVEVRAPLSELVSGTT